MIQGSTFILSTADKHFKFLLGLFGLGMALFISTCVTGIVALALVTWFVLQQMCHLFIEITMYANHSDILTQILLILVIGFVLHKVYCALASGVRGLRS
jgi:hypothetical protein